MASVSFDLVHSGICGPTLCHLCPVIVITLVSLMIIRVILRYILCVCVQIFTNMVYTQFNKRIKVFQSIVHENIILHQCKIFSNHMILSLSLSLSSPVHTLMNKMVLLIVSIVTFFIPLEPINMCFYSSLSLGRSSPHCFPSHIISLHLSY